MKNVLAETKERRKKSINFRHLYFVITNRRLSGF